MTSFNRFRIAVLLFLALASSVLAGCEDYDRPEFAEIDTSETGFLIPLEGDLKTQSAFASEQYLSERKIAAKRVQITHRWVQEGRMWWSGHWIPTVRLIKVVRSPVTRQWEADNKAAPAHDQAIWVESADSVGFSMGFTATAFVSEENAAKFLYWYPSGTLAQVMDTEVRARIQQVVGEVAAKYPLDILRLKKQEMADGVRADLVPFFGQRGITITTIGMFGGMTYENANIQKAIDAVFIDQQLKESEKAKLEAQNSINLRLKEEGEGQASRAREIAKGEADALREVSKAISEAQQSPLFLQLKMLEVEKARVEKWNGQYPAYMLSMNAGAGSPGLTGLPAANGMPPVMLALPLPGGTK